MQSTRLFTHMFFVKFVLFSWFVVLFSVFLPTQSFAQEQTIKISAVQITGGVGKTSEDFIELYNPSSEPVNLNGYRLVKRSEVGTSDISIKSWSSDTWIPAYGFFLWANSSFMTIKKVPDATTSATLADNNGIALRLGAMDTGAIIDSMTWGSGNNGFTKINITNPGAGESIVRSALFEDLGYQIAVSNPRNFTDQELPSVVNASGLVYDAVCDNQPTRQVALAGSDNNINVNFINSGTKLWVSEEVFIQNMAGEILPLGVSNILPGQSLQLIVPITAPIEPGTYIYNWRLISDDLVFGESCEMVLDVQSTLPETVEDLIIELTNNGSGVNNNMESIPEVVVGNSTPASSVTNIIITEILPNPSGADSGRETIELYNAGTTTIDLSGWILDDIYSSGVISSNHLLLNNTTILPGQYLVITIPSGKFALNNSSGDVVTLFNQMKQAVSSVSYSGIAEEGKSYSLGGDGWHWGVPSLGVANPVLSNLILPAVNNTINNPTTTIISGLILSEIMPSVTTNSKEYIEIFNQNNFAIELENVLLSVGSKIISLPKFLLPSQSYYVIQGQILTIPLADSGKLVQLLNQDLSVIDEVHYPKAIKGGSYSLFEDNWLWTLSLTPGQPNSLVATNPKPKATIGNNKLANIASVSSPMVNKAKKAVLKKKQNIKKISKPVSASKLKSVKNNVKKSPAPTEINTKQNKNKEPDHKTTNHANIVVVALATVGAGIFTLYKFGLTGIWSA